MRRSKQMSCFRYKHQGERKLIQIGKGKKGTTLVELIIAFALIGLFVVGSSQMIGVSLKTYHKIRGISYAKQVSDTLMDKITGEIEGGTKWTLRSGSNGDSIMDMTDKTGSHICITTTDNRGEVETGSAVTWEADQINGLLIYYYAVGLYESVGWTYDESMYMEFEIDQLKITEAGEGYGKDIIKVELNLISNKYGSYKTTRYMQSNLDETE